MSSAQPQRAAIAEPDLAERFQALRQSSLALITDLTPEDCNLQAMAETSPVKWHLAHTTWFFETFVLEPLAVGYLPVDSRYSVLFNSYYNGIGEQFPRSQRGLLSRPTLQEVLSYRDVVNAAVVELLNEASPHDEAMQMLPELIELGLHHEAQHQELLLTDIKYNLFQNPLLPAYRSDGAAEPPYSLRNTESADAAALELIALEFVDCAGGEISIGCNRNYDLNHKDATAGRFCFDNELPRHKVLLQPFQFANRLVSNGEYLEFLDDGGYGNPLHWLSDGWAEVQQHGWTQPLYWGRIDGQWFEYTLNGLQPLDLQAPVSHLSFYEAQAYASWAGRRLPTEAEWESVAQHVAGTGNFVDQAYLHPRVAPVAAENTHPIVQLFGDCWEWTNSAYLPYPGFRAQAGAVGEYNGKFMSGQMVLRGGSCMSRAFHIRASYRNFFYPRDRWQCTGIRLAADL